MSGPEQAWLPDWLLALPEFLWSDFMQCPTCGQHTADSPTFFGLNDFGLVPGSRGADALGTDFEIKHGALTTTASWMQCANQACKEIVIWIHDSHREMVGGVPAKLVTNSWIARPRRAGAPRVDRAVPVALAQDFQEAFVIMDDSPRMAAVLVRSIVEEILATKAQLAAKRLTAQITEFVGAGNQPEWLVATLDPLRALGDWGAHPFKDETTGKRLVADPDVIRWAVTEAVPQLFDHFYVLESRRNASIAHITQLNAAAGRDPLRGQTP